MNLTKNGVTEMQTTNVRTLLFCLALALGILAAPADRAAEAKPGLTATNGPVAGPETNPVAPAPTQRQERTILLTFRSASLDAVLNHLSEATDFIINIAPGTDIRGTVDLLSSQPITKEEAYDLLNTLLNQNGLTAIRNGRTLTIVSREGANKLSIPVIQGNDPRLIRPTDEMVTQIIGVRYANAVQIIKDLQPLLASYTSLTANESANALVLTGTRADVRRMVEIVRALDTSISSISSVRVFPLKYADAKALADTVKQMFQAPTSQQPQQVFRSMRGGGQGVGNASVPGVAGDYSQGSGDSVARQVASRVVAVGDDRSNSLVVSVPDEYLPTIEQLVRELDQPVNDITELRVFHLEHADPQETADEITQLFPDPTKSGQQNQPIQFGGGGSGGGVSGAQAVQASASGSGSDRMKKMGQVLAVADQRTASVVISAASQLMPDIAEVIAKLDSRDDGKQGVYIVSLENSEAADVLSVLQELFQQNSGTRNNSATSTRISSALSTRMQNNIQNQGRTTTTSTAGRTSTSSLGAGTAGGL